MIMSRGYKKWSGSQ